MLHKEIQNGVRVKAAEGGFIEGHANVFNVVDRQKEVVLPGAFAESVSLFKKGKLAIPLLDNHRVFAGTDAIVGKVTELREDKIGLYFKARLSETALAQEIRQKLKEGLLDSLSIGYAIAQDEVRRDGVRLLKKLHLREISVVIFPANEDAKVTGVKTDGALLLKARLAQLNRAEADLRYVEERLADLDRKERMLATIERLSSTKLTATECGWII